MKPAKKRRTKPGARKPSKKLVPVDWAPAFLAALSTGQSISESRIIAGVGRATIYDRRKADPVFARDMTDALDEACDALEKEARRRATLKKKGSDQLLMFLLRAHRPDVYGATVNHRGKVDLIVSVEDLSDDELRRIAAAEDPGELTPRRNFSAWAARRGLLAFTEYTYHDYQTNWHHRLIADTLDKFVRGEIKRLMLHCPPRTGKSELCSRRLPAFLLGRNPDEQIIACSNTSTLASDLNRECQRVMGESAYGRLFPETQLAGRNNRSDEVRPLKNSEVFEVVGRRGRYQAAGVGQAIVGRGFSVGIIDDPFSSREEADSAVQRNAVWNWYTGDFYTRRGPDARILINHTRWNPDDLAGRLLKIAEEDPKADQWTVLCLPAIREEVGCAGDLRRPGEALWPERYPLDELAKTKAANPYEWDSQYQQRPRAQGSVEWPDEHFTGSGFWFDDWPADESIVLKVMSLDPSKGKESKAGDYQALIMWARTRDGEEWVEADLAKRPLTATRSPGGIALTEGMVEHAVEMYRQFRPECLALETNTFQQLLTIPFRIEAKARKVDLRICELVNMINKAVRIRRLGEPLSQRRIRFRRTPGTRLLVEQLKQFPTADHDDGPDALEMARRTAIELWNGRQAKQKRR